MIGLAILLIVFFQLALFTLGQINRFIFARNVNALEVDLLKSEIEYIRSEQKKSDSFGAAWAGVRKFVVKQKVMESKDICSFYLAPHDKKPIPNFLPGQYLTFSIEYPGENRPLIRCYSLSDGPHPDYYRVSIKRLPNGRISSHFHDKINEGDILDVKAPSGRFYLDSNRKSGVVLIGGGIGVTPVMSMLNYLAENNSTQEIYFFYGVRDGSEHVMKEHMENVARQNSNIHLHVCYSKPTEKCIEDNCFNHSARADVNLLKKILPTNNFDFYFCGPGPMMESLAVGLKEWSVPDNRIHFETFGPSSVKKVASATRVPFPNNKSVTKKFDVTFKRSAKELIWDGAHETLLEFAEANDVSIASGCRAGSCGTCITAIQKGEVKYCNEPSIDVETGTCLTCISAPKTDIIIDA